MGKVPRVTTTNISPHYWIHNPLSGSCDLGFLARLRELLTLHPYRRLRIVGGRLPTCVSCPAVVLRDGNSRTDENPFCKVSCPAYPLLFRTVWRKFREFAPLRHRRIKK